MAHHIMSSTFRRLIGHARSRLKPLSVLFFGLSILCFAPREAAAQEEVVISGDRPRCRDCRLVFREIGRIGGPQDTLGLISHDAGRMQLHGGREVLVFPSLMPYVVAFYDLAGGEPRALGREGGGPGEYRRIQAVGVDSAGRLHVFADGRETVLSESGSVLETRPTPWRSGEVLFLPGGEYVLAGSVGTRDRAGFPLHVVGADGTVRHSFGKVGRGLEFDGFSALRTLAPSRGGRFWAADVNQYRLVQWDAAGRPRLELRRAPSWFEPWEQWTGPWEGRPPPRLADIHEDAAGRLWTMTWVADRQFQRISPDDVDIRDSKYAGDHPLYDTIIEVLDVDSGELLLSQRFGEMLSGFHPGGIVGGWDATPMGHQLFTFYRVRIESGGS